MTQPAEVKMRKFYNIANIPASKQQRSFSEQAYDILEEMIVTLVLPPGTTLTESELIERTGLGRTPMREALQRLSDVGLIDIIPRQGTKVTEINVGDQLLLLEVRRELERLIATSAARRRTAEQSSLLSEMAVEMRRAATTDDYLLFLRVDRAFNQCVAESSANRYLVKAITPIHALARRFWYKYYRPYDLPIAAIGHAEIMEAIVASDPVAAGAASDKLLDYVVSFTRSAEAGNADSENTASAPPMAASARHGH
jgi:DNA-binding GntR family transcriptional regulator